MSTLRVADLMSEDVVSVSPDDTLEMVYEIMDTRHIRHLPVLDSDGILLGLISHRDLARRVLSAVENLPLTEQQDVLRHMRAEQAMVNDPETIDSDRDIVDAGQTLLDTKFGCLPVIDGTRLVGILTEADFVKYVIAEATENFEETEERRKIAGLRRAAGVYTSSKPTEGHGPARPKRSGSQ